MEKDKNTHNEHTEDAKQVYGNASFGIPADCTQKQKMNGIKLACYIVVVVLICSVVYGSYRAATSYFLPVMTFDKSAQPVLYVQNADLMVKTDSDRRGKMVIHSEQLYNDSDSAELVQITSDGRSVFYAVESAEGDPGFDLYYGRISSVDNDRDTPNEHLCIDSGVTAYKIHPDGRFVLYLKEDRLYYSNLTDSHMVATGVTAFYLSKNNQQFIYYKDGSRIYTCGTGEKDRPVLVDAEIDKVLSEKEEYVRIYYLKQGALFLKEIDKEAVCIAENVKDGIMLGDYVYFVKEETLQKTFEDIFYDDKATRDKSLTEPVQTDYMVFAADGTKRLDTEAYDAAMQQYEEKLIRDTIRDYFSLHPMAETENVLYTVRWNGIKEVDSGLNDAALHYNSCKQTIVYEKEIENEEKIRLSSVENIEDALQKIEMQQSEEKKNGMYVLIKDKMPYLGLEYFPQGQIEISLDGKFLYCLETVGEDGRNALVRYTISSRELKNRTVLREGVTDFAVDGADSSIVIVFDENKLGLCEGDTYTHLSDSSCHSFFYVDGTLFFYDEYNVQTESGKLQWFRDGKVKLVDVGVHAFDVRNLKTVTYIKHFNQEFGFGDLYLKSGNAKGKKIDICVRSIIY